MKPTIKSINTPVANMPPAKSLDFLGIINHFPTKKSSDNAAHVMRMYAPQKIKRRSVALEIVMVIPNQSVMVDSPWVNLTARRRLKIPIVKIPRTSSFLNS